jgi:hypothetical protein
MKTTKTIDRAEVESLIERSPLWARATSLKGLLLPGFRLRASGEADANLPVGSSKAGGRPDLPRGWRWPSSAQAGVPLDFILQVNLRDLAGLDGGEGALPSHGLLSFFYLGHGFPRDTNPRDDSCWRVLYCAGDASSLARQSLPTDLLQAPLTPCSLSFAREWVLPTQREPWFPMLGLEADAGLPTWGEAEHYYDLLWELAEHYGAEREPVHRLLGYPETIGCSDQRAAEAMQSRVWRTYAPGSLPIDWRLLLQVDEDEALGSQGRGRLFFWIHQQDLEASRFEHVRLMRLALADFSSAGNANGRGGAP